MLLVGTRHRVHHFCSTIKGIDSFRRKVPVCMFQLDSLIHQLAHLPASWAFVVLLMLGLLAGLAPCNAALIPLWLGYILGVHASDSPEGEAPKRHKKRLWLLFTGCLGVVYGVLGSVVFVAKWLSYGLWFHPLVQAGLGVVILGMGFSLLVQTLFSNAEPRFVLARVWQQGVQRLQQGQQWLHGLATKVPSVLRLPLLAVVFAMATTPCASPALISASVVVGHIEAVWLKYIGFLVYGLGQALPLLVLGVVLPAARRWPWFQRCLYGLEWLSSLCLLGAGSWILYEAWLLL